MAHKTIALTTELKEPYMLGQSYPLSPGKQRDGAWPLFAKVCQFGTSEKPWQKMPERQKTITSR